MRDAAVEDFNFGNLRLQLLLYRRGFVMVGGQTVDFHPRSAWMALFEVHLGRLQAFVDGATDPAAVHPAAIVADVVIELLLNTEERATIGATEVARAGLSVVERAIV